jgi:type 1 glutamine amidotransferase
MKVLLVNDDLYHPGSVPEEGVRPLKAKGFLFDILSDGVEFSPEKLAGYPAVMLAKSDNRMAGDRSPWVTEDVRHALLGYVRDGGGLLVVHSGTAGFTGMQELHGLLGGLFMTHPKQLPIEFQPKAGHPLAEGVQAFTVSDEHYFMDMADEPVDVFLTSASRHGILPAGWARSEGSGRVCVLTPGHTLEVWLNPDFQQLLMNALNWCGRK